MPIFQVIKTEGSVDTWGLEQEADYEVGRGEDLAIVVFEPRSGGLSHATWVAHYKTDEWADVRIGESD